MTSPSVAAGASITAAQYVLGMFQTSIAFGSYLCPETISFSTATATNWDYIIVGAGTAGSAVANRLSESTNASILVIDEGGCPPIESLSPGLFTLLPQATDYDYAISFSNDSYTCQNQQPQGGATTGKMWGGSGSLDHMIHVRGSTADYVPWCTAANDSSWCGEDLNKFMAKSEAVTDSEVLAQNSNVHGTDGPIAMKRQKSDYLDFVFEGANEMGISTTDDTLPTSAQWINFPLLTIANGTRTCGNAGYMKGTLTRSNVKYLTARVDKVNFNDTTAIGVQITANNVTYNVTASKKIVLSAGALQTPIILMRSGVGNSTALAGLGVKSIVDNDQVGMNLMDHLAAPFAISFNESASPTLSGDPHEFPVPTNTMYQAFDSNQTYPDCQSIFLLFPSEAAGFLQLCYNVFKYTADICDTMYNLNKPLLFDVLNLMHPVSTGSVFPNSTNIYGDPIVKLGLLSNSTDLTNAAACIKLAAAIVNTTAFQSKGAEFVDLGLCSDYTFNSTEYWQCYVMAMSSTMWHYSGTCSIGKVVDASLNVMGTTNLKVIDGSVMPSLISGNIASAVRGIAEKGADIIKTEDGCV